MINEGLFSSNSDEWTTPDALYQLLNEEFHFTTDLAASHNNHKCEKYFTQEDDALKQEWTGTCFLNPPYSNIKDWVKKAYESAQNDSDTTIVMLIPSRTDTRYYHEYISCASEIRFLKGRLKFSDSKNSAPFPSAVVVFKNLEEQGLFMGPNVTFWDWKNP